MHNSKTAWFRAIIFFMVFIMINYGLIFLLLPRNEISRMTMREMYSQTENIDVAFAGASLSVRINPYIMDEELGCNTFDYAFPGHSYIGTYYSLKELFKYHKPKLIVLTTDSESYIMKEEPTIRSASSILYIKSFWNKIQYYFASAEDSSYLDRLFAWKVDHVKSINDVVSNIQGKLQSSYINYPESGQLEDFAKRKNGYIGKGALLFDSNDTKNVINYDQLGKFDNNLMINISDIKEKNIEYFKEISELCKANNCELILLNTPVSTPEVLKVKNYFEFDNEVVKIAKESNIEYYNYNLIKPELFKSQEDYFMDIMHLNSNGGEAFSKSLAAFLKLRQNGEDMKKYFYTPEEYYASIKYVTNTWFTWKKSSDKITLTADSFHGSNVVPEYQFILTDLETGKNDIIRDYNKDPNFVFDCKSYKKYKIQVNARVADCNNDELTRYYEEDVSK